MFPASLALLATLVNISYFFNYEDLHPCHVKVADEHRGALIAWMFLAMSPVLSSLMPLQAILSC